LTLTPLAGAGNKGQSDAGRVRDARGCRCGIGFVLASVVVLPLVPARGSARAA
jgi:hypothetical protein